MAQLWHQSYTCFRAWLTFVLQYLICLTLSVYLSI